MKDWHLLAKTLGSMNGGIVSGFDHQNAPVRINGFEEDKLHLVAENARSIASIFEGIGGGILGLFFEDEYDDNSISYILFKGSSSTTKPHVGMPQPIID
jgi:hypothetical protein